MSKKIGLLICSLAFFSIQFAQNLPLIPPGKAEVQTWLPSGSNLKTLVTLDTLTQYIDRASSAILYNNTTGGYIFGTSWFPDTSGTFFPITEQTAMHFDSVGTIGVVQVLFWAAKAKILGFPDSLEVFVYSARNDSSPDQVLGHGKMSMLDVTASSSFTLTPFPVSDFNNYVTSDFLVSLRYKNFNDTLGIVASNDDSGDGKGENRLRQLTSSFFGGSWVRTHQLWTGGLDVDAFLIPVVDNAFIGIDNPVGRNGLYLKGAFPNPASDEATLLYGLDRELSLQLQVFDLQGRIHFDSGKVRKGPGDHAFHLDLHHLPAGNYYYRLSGPGSSVVSQLTVVK
ncbi:MAG: T9SS type A sorting domain-containing protein [Bacteroidia bacterium]|nr:T9SS type A sorting domain-containing protein [Bacteroidia bacterium]